MHHPDSREAWATVVALLLALIALGLIVAAFAVGFPWEIGMGLFVVAMLVNVVALYRIQTRGRP